MTELKVEFAGPVKITVRGGEIVVESESGAIVIAPRGKIITAKENAGQRAGEPPTLASKILKFARDRGGPFNASAVAEALKIPVGEARTYLAYLARKGLLRRVRRGVYAAAEGA
mgnify:CR=1 FL=1